MAKDKSVEPKLRQANRNEPEARPKVAGVRGEDSSHIAGIGNLESIARLSEIFKALGEPTRVAIVALLRGQGGGLSVGEICLHITRRDKAFSSTVSHHLKELRGAGIVLVEKRGKLKLCRLAPEILLFANEFLSTETDSLYTKGGVGTDEQTKA